MIGPYPEAHWLQERLAEEAATAKRTRLVIETLRTDGSVGARVMVADGQVVDAVLVAAGAILKEAA